MIPGSTHLWWAMDRRQGHRGKCESTSTAQFFNLEPNDASNVALQKKGQGYETTWGATNHPGICHLFWVVGKFSEPPGISSDQKNIAENSLKHHSLRVAFSKPPFILVESHHPSTIIFAVFSSCSHHFCHFPSIFQHFPSIFHEKNTDTVHVTPLRLLAESQEPQ